jgi:hypothetical protein
VYRFSLEFYLIKQDENERQWKKFANEFQIGISSKSVAINGGNNYDEMCFASFLFACSNEEMLKRGHNANRDKYLGKALNSLLCLI